MNRKLKLILQIFLFLCAAVGITQAGFSYQSKKRAIASQVPDFVQMALNIDKLVHKEDLKQSIKAEKNWLDVLPNPVSRAKLKTFNQSKSWAGYTLYPISGPDEIHLLNHRAEIVHRWTNLDADRARLLPNGNIVVLHGSKNRLKVSPWKELRNRVSEYDWDGKLVWSYTSPYVIHHDLQRFENGNTLLILKVPVPKEYLAKISDPLRKTVELKSDRIIEINQKGEEVWHWNAWEHIDLNECGVRACPGKHTEQARGKFDVDDFKDWTHLNTISVIPENKWFDEGDKRFKPGNVIVMPRNFWTIYILDRDSGKIVWEYTGDYKGGLAGGHEPSMIAKGLPGAGNIIVLDNASTEERGGASAILEINPQTKKTVWVYDAGQEFFTRARGSVQRLPNGNTLISEDRRGRVFEVTPEKEVVWDYPGDILIVRAHRYAPDYSDSFLKLKLN